MSEDPRPDRAPLGGPNPVDRARRDVPLWQQAAIGIGFVTLGALLAIAVGVLLSAVATWLF